MTTQDSTGWDAILTSLSVFKQIGLLLNYSLLACSVALLAVTIGSCLTMASKKPQRLSLFILVASALILVSGCILVIWLNFKIYANSALVLPETLVNHLNRWLANWNISSIYEIPLYDPASPPRYMLPFWLENEKYVFWFASFALMALLAWRKAESMGLKILLQILLIIQLLILCVFVKPFHDPLPRFFHEVSPFFLETASPGNKFGLFMRMYPRMIFYYNAPYMWFHPPLLFLAYSALTIFFACAVVMFFSRSRRNEKIGYSYAKFAYLLLTVGMLAGYPWALKAWGPNWWWDPKIAASLMMWVVFTTYLHARLYIFKKGMWHFVAMLGIMSFIAMVFTFVASFIFPGQHSVH